MIPSPGPEIPGPELPCPRNHKSREQSIRISLSLPTRWMDNDIYGHVNNALYYAFFDTAINEYLIAEGGLDITAGAVVAFAAESQCQYLRPLAFPE